MSAADDASQSAPDPANLLQSLSLDSQSNSPEISEPGCDRLKLQSQPIRHARIADLNNAAYVQSPSQEQHGMESASIYEAHFQTGAHLDNAPMTCHQADGSTSYVPYPTHFHLYVPYVPSQGNLFNSATPGQNLSFVENASGPVNSNAGGETGNNVAAAIRLYFPNSLGRGISPSGYFQLYVPSQDNLFNPATSEQNLSFVENASGSINSNAGGETDTNVPSAIRLYCLDSLGRDISPSGNNDQQYASDASRTPAPCPDGHRHADTRPQYLTNTFYAPSCHFQLYVPYVPSQGNLFNPATSGQNLSFVENASGPVNSNAGGETDNNVAAAVRLYCPNTLGRGISPSGYNDQQNASDASRTPAPWSGGPRHADTQPQALPNTTTVSSLNQSAHPQSHLMGMYQPTTKFGVGPAHRYVYSMYPPYQVYGTSGYEYGFNNYNARAYGTGYYVNSSYKSRGLRNCNKNTDASNKLNQSQALPSNENKGRSGYRYGSNCYNARTCSSYESRGLGNGNENIDVSNELNQGQALPSNENNDKGDDNLKEIPGREQYNLADIPLDYTDAKFFIIKSYSKEDVHNCIKYGVWTSITEGNKKLDAAYQEAHWKSGGCPVFLFFSVIGSGKFAGVAEMTSPVDFDKNVEYWRQKRNGRFSVKWHIVKDVWNASLKHIRLEENGNNPVTHSRDTQEVNMEKGLQMLKVIKEYPSKKSIPDNYECREKEMQDKRAQEQQAGNQTIIHKKNKAGQETGQEIESDVSADLNEESTEDSEDVDALET